MLSYPCPLLNQGQWLYAHPCWGQRRCRICCQILWKANWIIVLCLFIACGWLKPPCDYLGSSVPQLHPAILDWMALNTGEEIQRKYKERRESGKSVLVAQTGTAVHPSHQKLTRGRGLGGAARVSDRVPPGASCSTQSHPMGMVQSLPSEQGDR